MPPQLRQSLKLTKKWKKVKGQVLNSHLTAWTLEYLAYPPTGCNPLHPRSCGNDHSRKGIMLQSWALFFIFCLSHLLVLHAQSLIPHSFPHVLLGPPPSHLTCYSSFDLSSIYAVKYHLTMRIRLYQLSFLISMIPGLCYRFPAFSDLPVI